MLPDEFGSCPCLSRDVVEFKIRNQKGMNWLYFQKPTNLSNYCLGSAAPYC